MDIKSINLKARLPNFNDVVSIGTDFILMSLNNKDNLDFPDFSYLQHPHKMETTGITFILEGGGVFLLDLNEHKATAPCVVVYSPGQILQYVKRETHHHVRHIHFSTGFIDQMEKHFKDISLFNHQIKNHPTIPLTHDDLKELLGFYDKARSIALDADNPYRMDMIIHLAALLFYSILSRIKTKPDEVFKSGRALLVNNFLKLVRDHHTAHRELSFYAERLHLTPKYLTTVIKKESGVSASDWIERYVILQAQALLKSTDLTIQQISDKLHFSSQVFFGKYFKRLVGMPPKEYRKVW